MLYSIITNSKNYTFFLLLFLLIQLNISAQVGIGTTSPSQSLHVAGSTSTIRVEGLNSANNANNDGITESALHVDSNGDLVLKPQFPMILTSLTGTSLIPTPIEIESPTGSVVYTDVASGNFTNSKNGVVIIEFNVQVGSISQTDGSIIDDGAPRFLILDLRIDGTLITRDSHIYTNYSTGADIAGGSLTLSGFTMMNLTAGLHTFKLRGGVYGNDYNVEATFGSSSIINKVVIVEQ